MATQTDPIKFATSITSMLKLVKNPNSSDILNAQLKMGEVVSKMPKFFESIEFEINPKIQTEIYTYGKKMNQTYLLVLAQISKVLGTCIYMKEILLDDDIEPKQQLIVTAYQPEFIIITHFIRYLNHYIKGLKKTHKNFPGNKTKVRAQRERELLKGIYNELLKSQDFTKFEVPYNRFNKVLHSVINNYKFVYQNMNENPQFGGKIKFKKLVTKKPKFKKQKLLWC